MPANGVLYVTAPAGVLTEEGRALSFPIPDGDYVDFAIEIPYAIQPAATEDEIAAAFAEYGASAIGDLQCEITVGDGVMVDQRPLQGSALSGVDLPVGTWWFVHSGARPWLPSWSQVGIQRVRGGRGVEVTFRFAVPPAAKVVRYFIGNPQAPEGEPGIVCRATPASILPSG
jgi:hypothetical protein